MFAITGLFRLGAPGTAPPKQLVQRYAGMTSSGLSAGLSAGLGSGLPLGQLTPVHRHLSLRSTVEQLQDICLSQGWGEPLYSLLSAEAGEETSKAGQFCYKVSLPNFPLPAPHNTFQSSGWKLTAEEAKAEVAGLVLSVLRVSPEYLNTAVIRAPYDQPAAATPPLYPLNPAQLQGESETDSLTPHTSHLNTAGLPLTAGWPAGFALAPSSLYNRLAYDPYNNAAAAAYANMINSMYGLSISV